MSTRRARRPPRRGFGDLGRRVLFAVPAIGYAIAIIVAGGWIFAAGILVLGFVCLHELFRMYDWVRPVRLAGFLALTGLAVAALEGGERQVLLATVATLPLIFLLGLVMPRREDATLTHGMAITLFGTFWVGMAIAHAIMLRELEHGDGIVVDVLVGTFLGDTGAYLGGRWFGTHRLSPRISPNKTVEGLVIGFLTAVLFTWAAGLYQDWLTHGQALILGAAVGHRGPARGPRGVGRQARRGHEGRGRDVRAARRSARPPRRGILLARDRVLRLAGAPMTDDEDHTERQMAELLQELRVALPGVQILFAFLLTVPFAQGFSRVTSFQRNLFFAVLLATAASTVFLIAPTATHRLRFHKGDRKYVIESAHR